MNIVNNYGAINLVYIIIIVLHYIYRITPWVRIVDVAWFLTSV